MYSDKINAAFRLNGGIGTYLVELNFIQHLYDAFVDCLSITVYGETSAVINDGLMAGQYFIDRYRSREDFHEDGYDIVVDINWFPRIRKVNLEKITAISSELTEMVNGWMDFQSDRNTRNLVSESSMFDYSIYTYAIANGKNRLEVMDITSKLGIEKNFRYKLLITQDEDVTLKKFGLAGKRYITMQQGVNAMSGALNSPRQWPIEYFSKLCRLIKSRYPDLILVQLGELSNNKVISGVDYCLLGKTDFEELKVLLKNAFLHFDGECGMVHMRSALRAEPSIVLYGQTPIKVVSYPNNINISANVCQGCAKLFSAWKRRCFISNEPICMISIIPEFVFDAIEKYIENAQIAKIVDYTNRETNMQKETLLNRYGNNLDSEWTDRWLAEVDIYGFAETKLTLDQLYTLKLTEDGYIKVRLNEHPAYLSLTGDKSAYINYMELNDRFNTMHEHSASKFAVLVDSLNRNGARKDRYIVIDGGCTILDGAHFASWLLYQYDEEHEVNALKIYGHFQIVE